MCYNTIYITVVAELEESINVFAERLKLESPFSTDAATIYGLRAFLFGCVVELVDTRGLSPLGLYGHAGSSPAIPTKISGSNRFYPDCLKRYIENDEFTKIQSRVFKGRTGRNAKHSISGISERKGDDLTGSIPDHAVVAHSKNNKQYRINDFLSTCFNSYCFTGLVIGDITLYPL